MVPPPLLGVDIVDNCARVLESEKDGKFEYILGPGLEFRDFSVNFHAPVLCYPAGEWTLITLEQSPVLPIIKDFKSVTLFSVEPTLPLALLDVSLMLVYIFR